MIRSTALLVLALLCLPPAAALAGPGIDANTATEVELDAISGIGPALAARIVEERRKAPFSSLDDLEQRLRAGVAAGPASTAGPRAAGAVPTFVLHQYVS